KAVHHGPAPGAPAEGPGGPPGRPGASSALAPPLPRARQAGAGPALGQGLGALLGAPALGGVVPRLAARFLAGAARRAAQPERGGGCILHWPQRHHAAARRLGAAEGARRGAHGGAERRGRAGRGGGQSGRGQLRDRALPRQGSPARHFAVPAHRGPSQEDRFTVAPNFEPEARVPCSFFGVFDGTVGDFASERVKDLVIPMLQQSPSWRTLKQMSAAPSRDASKAQQERLLEDALRDMYQSADESLLRSCAKHAQNYATCTSVTLVVVGDLLGVGHLGDSRIIFGKDVDGQMVGEQMTLDHSPDNEKERQRIEESGGTVVRLRNHGPKSFIRGGDFMARKASGDRPMQLMYSRAFGCKDLKRFGLSSGRPRRQTAAHRRAGRPCIPAGALRDLGLRRLVGRRRRAARS
ncbi:unnamed protein product, partial [Prorocentrum cordatum]